MTIGQYALCAFLILTGLTLLIGGLGIPVWVTGLVAITAGILLLIGR